MVLATLASLPPEPPQLSLLTMAARPSADVDPVGAAVGDRWTAGFAWSPNAAGRVSGYNDCGTRHLVDYRTNQNDGIRQHQPVVLETEYVCSTLGFDWDFYRAQAVATMLAAEPVAAEEELWEGTLARAAAGIGVYDSNRWLTKYHVATDVTPTPGTAVKPRFGLSLLEDFLGDNGYGSRGMIHITRGITPHLGVRVDGSSLLSNLNNLVVPGAGYTGSGPATQAGGAPTAPDPGTAWAYCTGRVTYRNSEIVVFPDDVAEAVDRSVNTVRVVANRYSAATWDLPVVGAVLIDTTNV